MLVAIVDFWFEFASTYSYPAAMRAGPLAEAAGVKLRWRPFLLGPIFKAQGWDTSPFNVYPVKGRYMWRDLERICADHNLPFRPWPGHFPQSSLLAARVALVGLQEGWGEDFARSVYRAQFGEGKRIDDPAVISELIAARDLAPAAVFAKAQSEQTRDKLRAETGEAQRIGIFGAPSFVTADGEIFWGNDRLERALAWTKRAG